MKKVIFVLLMSLFLTGALAQEKDKKTMEVIPTISAVGGLDGISLNSELIIAKKFTLTKNHKWFLFGQLGTMYNLFQNEVGDGKFTEWQLGLEPMVGFGTNRFRVSGFLNGLAVKAWDTGKMPFVEGGVRFSIVPWRTVWLSVFSTWPISDPVFISPLGDSYFETEDGVFLVNIEQWAKQVRSYGADIDLVIGKKIILNLDGFAIDENNYQVGGGLQYRLFKNKPWVIGGNVSYTNFQDHDYYYVQNIFPGMFGEDLQGYTFKLGIANYGGLGEVNFSQMLGRIAEPMYFSPVKKELVKKTTRIGEAFKFEPCGWGGECLNFEGSLCITGGRSDYKLFVNWGEGKTESYNVKEMGPFKIRHSYLKPGEYNILISGMDGLGKTHSYSGKFTAKDCTPITDECRNVTLRFDVDQNTVKLGDTLNFFWSVQNAEIVNFDGKEVADSVKKWPVIFPTLGSFSYTLAAFNKGKLCVEKTITVNVVNCEIPIIDFLTVTPSKVIGSGDVTVSWSVQKADKVFLEGVIVAASGSKVFNVTGPKSWLLEASNSCASIDKTVSVEWEETPCPTATSSASQGFEINPSEEINWVNKNVFPGPWVFLNKDEFFSGNCTTAHINASVVLIKAGTKYIYYLNVTQGQRICSYDGKTISHVSYFTCE